MLRVTLVLLRNLLPFAGYTWWNWPANDVVMLGAFNLQSVFTCTGISACAAPRLMSTDTSRAVRWAVAAVLCSWAAIFGVAIFFPTLVTFDAHASIGNSGVWWSALGLSVAVGSSFTHELLERARSEHRQTTMSPGFQAVACGVKVICPTLMGMGAIATVAMTLADESVVGMGVITVVASALFLDLLRMFAPSELPHLD